MHVMRISALWCAVVLLYASVALETKANVVLFHNVGASTEHVAVPYFFGRNSKRVFATFNATLVVPGPASNISGKAAFAIFPEDRRHYREWVLRGIVGILVYYDTENDVKIGNANFIKMYGDSLENLGVPVLGQRSISSIPENDTIAMFVYAENKWYNTYSNPSMLAFHLVLVTTTGLSLSVAVVRLLQFLKLDGFRLSVPKVALGVEIVGNLLRLAWCLPDPLGYLFLFPGWYNEVFKIYHASFSTISNLLIVLYWHDTMITMSLQPMFFLNKLAVPFYVIAGFVVVVETALAIARALLFPHAGFLEMLYASAIFGGGVNFVTNLYLQFITWKLWKRIRLMAHRGQSNEMLKRLFVRVAITVVLMTSLGMCAISWMVFSISRSDPIYKLVFWLVFACGFNALSIAESISFLPSQRTSTSSSSPNSNRINLQQNASDINSAGIVSARH